ncbi:ERF family protein [Salibacterium aidingense]|uniref:ERF family protein n=1 Tax=Salibacterium aidingense TaxID=384933 RepID=UPI00040A2779|nr:ERF family protein [Salibacterium aidingense]
MSNEKQIENIFQKLLRVRKAIPYIQKQAQGDQYQYATSSQVLALVREQLDEVGLILLTNNTGKEVNFLNNNAILTELHMEYVWVNADNPEETVTVPFYAQGMDYGTEKGVGKALTYGEKNFLLKQFNIPTDELDPDAFQSQTSTPTYISSNQAKELNNMVAELGKLRGCSPDNFKDALNVKTFEKVQKQYHKEIYNKVKGWLVSARQRAKENQGQETRNTKTSTNTTSKTSQSEKVSNQNEQKEPTTASAEPSTETTPKEGKDPQTHTSITNSPNEPAQESQVKQDTDKQNNEQNSTPADSSAGPSEQNPSAPFNNAEQPKVERSSENQEPSSTSTASSSNEAYEEVEIQEIKILSRGAQLTAINYEEQKKKHIFIKDNNHIDALDQLPDRSSINVKLQRHGEFLLLVDFQVSNTAKGAV